MTYIVKEETNFKQLEAGVYPARCIRIIGLGTQHSEYQGKPVSRVQVLVVWELPTELIEDGERAGQPHIISKFYTSSISEKATLRKHLVSWRGKDFTREELNGFNLNSFIGKTCLLSIVHSDKGKAKVDTVTNVPKGTTVPDQINPSVAFNVFQWDQETFDSLSAGIRKIIQQSDEYALYQFSDSTVAAN